MVQIVEKGSERNEKRKKNPIIFLVMIDYVHNFQVFWVQCRSKMMFISKVPQCSDRSFCDLEFIFVCDS